MFGPAWRGRRVALLQDLEHVNVAIDVGAGEGFLVGEAQRRGLPLSGYEPSSAMRRRALRRSTPLMRGEASSLAVQDNSIDAIVVTYPGPWIFESTTWLEFARVLRIGGRIQILASGDVRRGPGATFRCCVLSLAYGAENAVPPELCAAALAGISGEWQVAPDLWGTVVIWSGGLDVAAEPQANSESVIDG